MSEDRAADEDGPREAIKLPPDALVDLVSFPPPKCQAQTVANYELP
jgi:hypothetical protein